ncbi:hypothetical protein FQZ97_1218930 [compost metagenome]
MVQKLSEKYQQRLKVDEDLKELVADIEDYRSNRDIKELSLNYETRKKEMEEAEKNRKSIKKLNKSIKEEDKENDVYLLEGEKILSDLIALRKS